MYFLQCLDNETYSLLQEIELELEDDKKSDATRFCEIYKEAFYKDLTTSLMKRDLMNCKQKSDETVK